MTKFYFIRHAYTGMQERMQKPEDDLDTEGLQQANRLADRAKDISPSVLYTSPYQRALSTARYISRVTNIEMITDERLREIPLWAAPQDLHHDSQGDHIRLREVLHRAQDSVAEMLHDLVEKHLGGRIVLVCHGNLIRAVMGYTLEMSLESIVRLEVHHVSITELEWEDKYEEPFYRLLRFNDTAHLE